MVEQKKARATHIMERGDYLQPGARVSAKTPRVLHAWRKEWPRNRLGLARWLVDRDNPLVARVTVNRLWARIFGRGLVPTEEDFGTRGAKPSHPELLDWLAVEFMDAAWSRKHILRLIVTSKTYRQSSKRRGHPTGTDEAGADPHNVWLARGPRFRMSAEMIRDNALAVSGLLSTKAGGPARLSAAARWALAADWAATNPSTSLRPTKIAFRRGVYVILAASRTVPELRAL